MLSASKLWENVSNLKAIVQKNVLQGKKLSQQNKSDHSVLRKKLEELLQLHILVVNICRKMALFIRHMLAAPSLGGRRQ